MSETANVTEDFSRLDRSVISRDKFPGRTWQINFSQEGVAVTERTKEFKVIVTFMKVMFPVAAIAAPIVVWFIMAGASRQFRLIAAGLILATEVFGLLPAYFLILRPMARTAPLVFDRRQGRFWRQGGADPIIGDYAPLADVAALQAVSKEIRGESRYKVWELNVVLRRPAGQRLSIMCHGKADAFWADARQLAEFLHVPLLDHTGA